MKTLVPATVLALACLACHDKTPTDTLCTANVTFTFVPAETTLSVGQHFTPRVTLSSCDGRLTPTDFFFWTSQDPTVASVDEFTGLATAVGQGQTSFVARGLLYGPFVGPVITVK